MHNFGGRLMTHSMPNMDCSELNINVDPTLYALQLVIFIKKNQDELYLKSVAPPGEAKYYIIM